VRQPDGKILASGWFSQIGGQSRTYIARLDSTTGAADSWNANANDLVHTIALQSDGKILVSGFFFIIGGQTRNYIARLDPTTARADSWNPNASHEVFSIALQPDGKVLAGGQFTSIGGQPRSLFARLSNNTAALSSLNITRTSVTLTRDGSAAPLSRVVFELSTDYGATWTSLGQGSPSLADPADDSRNVEKLFAPAALQASNYSLTGLNLPAQQNILVRARGYYRTGFRSNSETTEDKVQDAFLFAPTAAAVTLGGRVLDSYGRGLKDVVVSLTTGSGETLRRRTGAFGYYSFDGIAAGQTVIVSAQSKLYQFAPQVVTTAEDVSELNFFPQ
jgi:hypothetical protein